MQIIPEIDLVGNYTKGDLTSFQVNQIFIVGCKEKSAFFTPEFQYMIPFTRFFLFLVVLQYGSFSTIKFICMKFLKIEIAHINMQTKKDTHHQSKKDNLLFVSKKIDPFH